MPEHVIAARVAEARRILASPDAHQTLRSLAWRVVKRWGR